MNPGASAAVTGYVLAGGRSSRMGQDKAYLQRNGKPLIEHALALLQDHCSQVFILCGPVDDERALILSCYAPLVFDKHPGYQGPLAAFAAAASHCPTPYALILPIDQPNLSSQALQLLLEQALSAGALAACLQYEARPEPLPMFLSRELCSPLHFALDHGERRLLATVQTCAAVMGGRVSLVPTPCTQAAADWFVNLNTPQDLHQWQQRSRASTHLPSGASEKPYG